MRTRPCANAPAVSLSSSVTVASGGIWTGGGGTFNPNNTSLTTTYTPSAAEIAAGSVTLTLTSVGNGNSNPVSDQVVITITPAPVAEAGPCAHQLRQPAERPACRDGERCHRWPLERRQRVLQPVGGQPQRGVHAQSGGDRGGQRGDPDPDHHGQRPVQRGERSVTLTIAPAPVVNAGLDQLTCSNNPTAVLNGSVTNAGGGIWSGGTGGFSPNITALGAAYTPSATGPGQRQRDADPDQHRQRDLRRRKR
ncbi:MAG: hypothetical protein H6596_08485 [Flavobacteriales bacterium]|nr:hypothetical protein [Flavobacteriales bacterium]